MEVCVFEMANFFASEYIVHSMMREFQIKDSLESLIWTMWAYKDYVLDLPMSVEEYRLFEEITTQPVWEEAKFKFERFDSPDCEDRMVYYRAAFREDFEGWKDITVDWLLSA